MSPRHWAALLVLAGIGSVTIVLWPGVGALLTVAALVLWAAWSHRDKQARAEEIRRRTFDGWNGR